LQLRNIEYVLSIAETGSFSKSAKLLFISQPALSQAIQRLEEELGVKLFLRQNNATLITRAGELFIEDAQKVLMLSMQIKKKMCDVQDIREGSISFGLSQYNGQLYYGKTIIDFRNKYPNIKMHIVEDFSCNLEREVLKGNLDFALFTMPIDSDHLTYEHLFYEEILLAVPSDHAITSQIRSSPDRFGTVRLSEFRNDSFVLMKQKHRFRLIQDALFLKAGFEPKIAFESRSGTTIQSYVTGGIGLGLLTATQQRNTSAEWQSAYFHLEDVDAKREHVIAYNTNGYLPHAAKAFIALAKQRCEKQFYYPNDVVLRRS
jgi:LysR family hydrogen peroxide-inducible transcriptional activator